MRTDCGIDAFHAMHHLFFRPYILAAYPIGAVCFLDYCIIQYPWTDAYKLCYVIVFHVIPQASRPC